MYKSSERIYKVTSLSPLAICSMIEVLPVKEFDYPLYPNDAI
jgi:hypothetical protein